LAASLVRLTEGGVAMSTAEQIATALNTRREFMKRALLIGAGAAVLFGSEEIAHPRSAAAMGTQSDWRWCAKCQVLFYGPHASISACPAGGNHYAANSYNYELIYYGDPGNIYETGWRWCAKCKELFFGASGDGFTGNCPSGGQHDRANSYEYMLLIDLSFGQSNWRQCFNCLGLYYDPNAAISVCPGGGHHYHLCCPDNNYSLAYI
jgi:hypothetical protein